MAVHGEREAGLQVVCRSCQSMRVAMSSRREPASRRYVCSMRESRQARRTRTAPRSGPVSTTSIDSTPPISLPSVS